MILPLPVETPIQSASDPQALADAVAILAQGGCVAVPTETVYGLACDARHREAVAGVYAAKRRPGFNPLIVHVDSLERARTLVDLSSKGLALARAFWPGPLTLVAPKTAFAAVSDLATARLDSLAVRWPKSRTLTHLVKAVGRPLAAPSANASGTVSPTRAEHVKKSLNGCIHLILDGGPCPVGVESTIISLLDPDRPDLLRPGGVPRSSLETITGPLCHQAPLSETAPSSPGQSNRHYAPRARMRLNVTRPEPDEAYLGFGPHPEIEHSRFFNLSQSQCLAEAAANLFAGLHWLDSKTDQIAVAPIPEAGLGEAINDRLHRAAAHSESMSAIDSGSRSA